MKVKIFIVAYNNIQDLNQNLKSLYDNMGDSKGFEIEVNIINNHSNFYIDSRFEKEVKVYHNNVRPDFSTGHLARSWNQAILLGFKSLVKPDCSILITAQDDIIWEYKWLKWITKVHEKYDFYSCSWGDGFCSYTPNAVKMVGIWDERFCGIGFQEADYFLRCLIYNKERSSINDTSHGRGLNIWKKPKDIPDNHRDWKKTQPEGDQLEHALLEHTEWEKGNIANRSNYRISKRGFEAAEYHKYSLKFFKHKWGDITPENWTEDVIKNSRNFKPLCSTYMYYPYFERHIKDLKTKNYIQFLQARDHHLSDADQTWEE